jgi:hypothetical protein
MYESLKGEDVVGVFLRSFLKWGDKYPFVMSVNWNTYWSLIKIGNEVHCFGIVEEMCVRYIKYYKGFHAVKGTIVTDMEIVVTFYWIYCKEGSC